MVRIVLITVVSVFLTTPLGFSQKIALKDLNNKPELFDNQKVEVEAEVLDILPREKGSWLNVWDGSRSIGVWVGKEVTIPKIKYIGGYKQEGDFIRVIGVFHSSCQKHLGQRDIHAQEIQIIKRGKKLEEKVSLKKKRELFFLSLVFLAIFIIYLVKIFLWKKNLRK